MSSVSALDICANCGKGEEESGKLQKCAACNLVKYCSRECQAAHRPQHKKACKKRASEIYDEKLFKEGEPDECPICFQPCPIGSHQTFESCCGKLICNGCVYAMKASEGGGDLYPCAFCRTPPASSYEENIKRLNKLMNKGNGEAFATLGGSYADGDLGLPQDDHKANELYLKAGELGSHNGYYNLGVSYDIGKGVEVDKKKAKHYYELAAMMGSVSARHNLGIMELKVGNHHRALKHYTIAAKAGNKGSLSAVKVGFMSGFVTKEEYANTQRAYQKAQDDMKSDMRDE